MNIINPSESLAQRQIEAACKEAFGYVRILKNLIVPGVLNVPTTEIDLLAICSLGVLIFEVKGYKSCTIYRDNNIENPNEKKVWMMRRNGTDQPEGIKDALAQSSQKYLAIQNIIDDDIGESLDAEGRVLVLPRIPVMRYVYFPSHTVTLDVNMPPAVLTVRDLPYMLRTLRHIKKKGNTGQHVVLDLDIMARIEALLIQASSGNTMEQHIANCEAAHPC